MWGFDVLGRLAETLGWWGQDSFSLVWTRSWANVLCVIRVVWHETVRFVVGGWGCCEDHGAGTTMDFPGGISNGTFGWRQLEVGGWSAAHTMRPRSRVAFGSWDVWSRLFLLDLRIFSLERLVVLWSFKCRLIFYCTGEFLYMTLAKERLYGPIGSLCSVADPWLPEPGRSMNRNPWMRGMKRPLINQ
jgi:hypothetical protein